MSICHRLCILGLDGRPNQIVIFVVDITGKMFTTTDVYGAMIMLIVFLGLSNVESLHW